MVKVKTMNQPLEVTVKVDGYSGQSFRDTTGCVFVMTDELNPRVEILGENNKVVATLLLQDLQNAVRHMAKCS